MSPGGQKRLPPLGQLGGVDLEITAQDIQRFTAQQAQDSFNFVLSPEASRSPAGLQTYRRKASLRPRGRRETIFLLDFVTHLEHSLRRIISQSSCPKLLYTNPEVIAQLLMCLIVIAIDSSLF